MNMHMLDTLDTLKMITWDDVRVTLGAGFVFFLIFWPLPLMPFVESDSPLGAFMFIWMIAVLVVFVLGFLFPESSVPE